MAKKNKKNLKNNFLSLLFKLLLIGLVYQLFKNKDKTSHFIGKMKEYAREEKREIEELLENKEGWHKFCSDSCNLFKKYFVPHEGNNHKPHILRSKSLVTIAVALLLIKASVVGYLFLAYPEGARMSEVLLSRVVQLTNQDREANNLTTLKINSVLNASAQAKANDLISKDYFAHHSPDGKKPWDFIDRGQYRYLFVGENLAMNFSTADSVHRALMNSPSHKKNILNDRYEDIGVAMASGMINGKQTNVLVELFGTTRSTTLAVVTPESAPAPSPAPVVEPNIEVAGEESKTETKPAPIPEPTPEPVIEPSPAPVPEPRPEPVKETQTMPESMQASSEKEVAAEPELIPDASSQKIVKANLSPNIDIEQNKVTEITAVKGVSEGKLIQTNYILKAVYYTFITVLIIMVLALLINIIVRVRVQHKHVIIQTMLLILFIGSLLYFQIHTMEGGIDTILLL